MKLKQIRPIGKRGVLFTFEFGDCVYLIKTDKVNILCDTSEGEEEMSYVKTFLLENNLDDKPLYIFNSHSDYDHIWGNNAFPDSNIIAHKYCRQRILEKGEYDLIVRNQKNITLKLPNITFTDTLCLADIGIEFVYTPGHTVCSASCIDYIDKVIYVGDNLEAPLPYLNHLVLDDYLYTLDYLKNLSCDYIISTHSGIVDKSLIDEHLLYLEDVQSGKYLTFSNEYMPIRHMQNMKNLLLLQHEVKMKKVIGKNFNYISYKNNLWNYISERHNDKNIRFWDISQISYQELKDYLETYIFDK